MKTKNLDIIKLHEGLHLDAYLPTPNDVPTIGYGHTKGVKLGQRITVLQANQFLQEDIAWAEDAVNSLVKVRLNQNQFDALVSFVFNIGATAFEKSTLLRLLNSGDYTGAANQFPRWNKQNGKVLNGLTKRRKEEQALFLSSQVDLKEDKPQTQSLLAVIIELLVSIFGGKK